MSITVIKWDLGPPHGAPLIDVTISSPRDVVDAGVAVGLEYNRTVKVTALLDTGAGTTVIRRKYADYCKLFLTNPKSQLYPVGPDPVPAWEHAAAISFPNTKLRPIESIKVLSAEFSKDYYAVLIGRDILQNWRVTFDGPARQIIIEEK